MKPMTAAFIDTETIEFRDYVKSMNSDKNKAFAAVIDKLYENYIKPDLELYKSGIFQKKGVYFRLDSDCMAMVIDCVWCEECQVVHMHIHEDKMYRFKESDDFKLFKRCHEYPVLNQN